MKLITFVGGPLDGKDLFTSHFPPEYRALLPESLPPATWFPDEEILPSALPPTPKTVRYLPVKDDTDDWDYVVEDKYNSYVMMKYPERYSFYKEQIRKEQIRRQYNNRYPWGMP